MGHTIIQDRPGRIVLGRYELLEQIGQGGFSTVYRAYDHKMGREVAVKAVLRTDELTDRAAREARAAAKLGHPHIVTVFELAEDEHEVYIVSELVRGRTLGALIDMAALSDRDGVEIILQVLGALGHAHSQGVIHRDIKPENIMLDEGSAPPLAKVTDFGIAQLEDTQRITRRGDVVGTLSYMSPEQADGRKVNGATDVYSAALTLYVGLTGSNPFRAENVAETVSRIQAGAPPLARVRPDLPAELSHVLEEAMDPDPGLRLELENFSAALIRLLPRLQGGEQATTVIKRVELPRPPLHVRIEDRYGFIAWRAGNAGLAAMVAAAAALGSDLYPDSWRIPMVLGTAAMVGLLPRIGLIGLAGVALAPVADYSAALGAILAATVIVYLLSVGLIWPRMALLPVLAAGLGALGLGLAYPALAGSLGRLKRGLVLAFAGAAALTLFQLLSGSEFVDYLGIANAYSLRTELAGQYNPAAALMSIAMPFRQHPVLLVQPVIWLAAALPAALLVRRRSLRSDTAGAGLAYLVLAAGYFAIPQVFEGYVLDSVSFLKTLVICAILQIGLLLIIPRKKLQSIPPRERT
ncbi:MAG: serine/threonine protein kinase [Thermoleophilia bacterium]|nr:serine/threonine protein kinase [Thermoleophilia bacterium]